MLCRRTTMGVRQTFGLYSSEFENTSVLQIQNLDWQCFTQSSGGSSPNIWQNFHKLGGNVVIIPALIFYSISMLLMGNNYVSGMWLQINLGLLVGVGLAGAAGTILTPMISKHFPNENRSKAAGFVTACGGLECLFFLFYQTYSKIFLLGKCLLSYFQILFLMCIPGLFVKLPEKKKVIVITILMKFKEVLRSHLLTKVLGY